MRRLREALVKSVSIYGVCKPLEAIIQIDRVEREEDKDYSFSRYASPLTLFHLTLPNGGLYIVVVRSWGETPRSLMGNREHWQSGPESCARGDAWLDRIYQGNRAGTVKVLDAHKDFGTHPFLLC